MKQILSLLLLLSFFSLVSASDEKIAIEKELDVRITVAESVIEQSKKEKLAETKKAFLQLFSKDITLLKESLEKGEYIISIDLLNQLTDKVKLQQKEDIDAFFPVTFEGLSSRSSSKRDIGDEFDAPLYGVAYTKKYSNEHSHSLEFNVVFSDESIKDFLEIVQNPNLAQGMQDTSIVSVQQYKALETVSEDKMYFEQNIILNPELMMTVVGIGIVDHTLIDAFLKQVKLAKLEAYFKK